MSDKLVKVVRKTDDEALIVVHIEVQSYIEKDFAKRLYSYNYRIADRYNLPVVSMAVFADESPKWKPDRYSYDICGFSLDVKFPL